MDSTEIKNELEQTYATLLEKISLFDETNINQKPSPEKWSAAQVAQHLILSGSGISHLLSHETETVGRTPNEMVSIIEQGLGDLGIQMNAPDFITPEEKTYQKSDLLEKLKAVKSAILQEADTKDLSKTYKSFEFPGWGYLTGFEILTFVNHHTQRHLKQLEKIYQSV